MRFLYQDLTKLEILYLIAAEQERKSLVSSGALDHVLLDSRQIRTIQTDHRHRAG